MTSEMMDVYGVNKDGVMVHVGKAPITPEMKMKDIARQYFGWNEEDMEMCEIAMGEFYDWLQKEGRLK